MSHVEKRWVTSECDESAARGLGEKLKLPLPVARVLLARGFHHASDAESFLNPRLSNLSDPFRIPGMDIAVDRIHRAIAGGEKILVFGDYDVDGVTSTVLLKLVLEQGGGKVDWFIPSRKDDGYGLTPDAVASCIRDYSPAVIVTVDCGVTSREAVAVANDAGVDVIVTDHHEPGDVLPDALAVINPKLGDDEATRMLAGVGVAFKLCHALVKRAIQRDDAGLKGLDLRPYLDLVAVGTVADVAPLMEENRILVRHGLERINQGARTGLAAIIRSAGIRTRIDCYHLGFQIGPRINAVGRLTSAAPAVELLLCQDAGAAVRLAGQLDAANRERKRIEEAVVVEAVEQVSEGALPEDLGGIVVAGEGWNVGTIGIVAARLCGRYHRPAVVITLGADGRGRGSCRSIEGVDVSDVLRTCEELLISCGGHKMAAGLVIEKASIEAFKKRFDKLCRESIDGSQLEPSQTVDAWIALDEADQSLLAAVESLRPLGLGNPTPTWGCRGVALVGKPRVVGTNHLKMVVASGGSQVDAIAFGMADRDLGNGTIDLLFQVQENNYMGRTGIQLNVKDFRPSAN